MIKGSVHQENITILNAYALNNRASKYMKQIPILYDLFKNYDTRELFWQWLYESIYMLKFLELYIKKEWVSTLSQRNFKKLKRRKKKKRAGTQIRLLGI